jgi:hypothetical protein
MAKHTADERTMWSEPEKVGQRDGLLQRAGRMVPERSTLRRIVQRAFARTPSVPPPNDFAEDVADAKTRVMVPPANATTPDQLARSSDEQNRDDKDNQDAAPRQRMATIAMTAPMETDLGSPPEMPQPRHAREQSRPSSVANHSLAVEDPTHMPHPRDIPEGSPSDGAAAPGLVPRGDSRSLRMNDRFVLIYRLGTFVVTRAGDLGTRGVWRVIEYPTAASASSAYARECSRWADTGYTDYRE